VLRCQFLINVTFTCLHLTGSSPRRQFQLTASPYDFLLVHCIVLKLLQAVTRSFFILLKLLIFICYFPVDILCFRNVVGKIQRTEADGTSFTFLIGSTALVGPGLFFSFLVYSQSVVLLGRVISSSQSIYLGKHRTAQTQNKHIYTPNIHVLSGIRAHDHSVRTSEDSSFLRRLGYRDRGWDIYSEYIYMDP
jgi:hypothetical protein